MNVHLVLLFVCVYIFEMKKVNCIHINNNIVIKLYFAVIRIIIKNNE